MYLGNKSKLLYSGFLIFTLIFSAATIPNAYGHLTDRDSCTIGEVKIKLSSFDVNWFSTPEDFLDEEQHIDPWERFFPLMSGIQREIDEARGLVPAFGEIQLLTNSWQHNHSPGMYENDIQFLKHEEPRWAMSIFVKNLKLANSEKDNQIYETIDDREVWKGSKIPMVSNYEFNQPIIVYQHPTCLEDLQDDDYVFLSMIGIEIDSRTLPLTDAISYYHSNQFEEKTYNYFSGPGNFSDYLRVVDYYFYDTCASLETEAFEGSVPGMEFSVNFCKEIAKYQAGEGSFHDSILFLMHGLKKNVLTPDIFVPGTKIPKGKIPMMIPKFSTLMDAGDLGLEAFQSLRDIEKSRGHFNGYLGSEILAISTDELIAETYHDVPKKFSVTTNWPPNGKYVFEQDERGRVLYQDGVFTGHFTMEFESGPVCEVVYLRPQSLTPKFVVYEDSSNPKNLLTNYDSSTIFVSQEENVSDISIPDWIKQLAKFWSDEQISDQEFVAAIEFMIKERIIKSPNISVDDTISSTSSEQTDISIPEWLRNNASWFSQGLIDSKDFANSLEWLVENDIIKSPTIKVKKSPPSVPSNDFGDIPIVEVYDGGPMIIGLKEKNSNVIYNEDGSFSKVIAKWVFEYLENENPPAQIQIGIKVDDLPVDSIFRTDSDGVFSYEISQETLPGQHTVEISSMGGKTDVYDKECDLIQFEIPSRGGGVIVDQSIAIKNQENITFQWHFANEDGTPLAPPERGDHMLIEFSYGCNIVKNPNNCPSSEITTRNPDENWNVEFVVNCSSYQKMTPTPSFGWCSPGNYYAQILEIANIHEQIGNASVSEADVPTYIGDGDKLEYLEGCAEWKPEYCAEFNN